MSWHRSFAAAVVAMIAVSCSSGDLQADDPRADDPRADAPGACSAAEGDRSVGLAVQSPPEDLLQWAGFEDTTGLDVLEADEECGRDIRVRIALRGDGAAVDAAVKAAGFDEPPTEGMSVLQTPLDSVDLDGLTAVVSSDQEAWKNGAGETMFRAYVRGSTGADDQEVLHIWAFTT